MLIRLPRLPLTPGAAFANALLASVVAGAVASVILCPAEGTRIRMVSDPNFAGGMVGGLLRLLREDGVLEVFNGLAAMLSKQVPYTAAKQVSFDVLATAFYNVPAMVKRAWTITFVSSVITSVIATIASQPGDVVLTEVYKPPPPQQLSSPPQEMSSSPPPPPPPAEMEMEPETPAMEMAATEAPVEPTELPEAAEATMTAVPAGGADYAAPSAEVYSPPKQYFDKFTNKHVVPPKLKKATTAAIAGDIFRRKGIGGFFVGTKARLGHVGGISKCKGAVWVCLLLCAARARACAHDSFICAPGHLPTRTPYLPPSAHSPTKPIHPCSQSRRSSPFTILSSRLAASRRPEATKASTVCVRAPSA